MPLANIPKHLQAKYERCVADVKARNKGKGKKVNPYAVCYTSVVGGSAASAAKGRLKKGGK